MTLAVVALVAVIAAGAGVGLVLREQRTSSLPTTAPAVTLSASPDPNAVAVTDEEIDDLITRHTKGLTGGDAETFLSIFDPADKALLKAQRRVFDNLRKVPLTDVSYQVLRRSGRSEDSFGRGVRFAQDVAFVHRFAGIDLRPVSQWYRWTLEKKGPDAPLRVTAVGGAPPPSLTGSASKTVYYPGPWDIWPDITVVRAGSSIVLAHPRHAALARRVAPTVASATATNLTYWKRHGDPQAPVPSGFVVALVAGQDQLGKLFRTSKADEAGVSIGMPSYGAFSDPVRVGGTRVVLDSTSGYFADEAGIAEITRHELAHSLVASLDSRNFSFYGTSKWIVEGFAEYLAKKHQPIARSRFLPEGRAYLAGRRAQPFTGRLPHNTEWGYRDLTSAHYFMGELAMRLIAERHGDRKLAAAVAAAYRAPGDASEAALFDSLGVSKATFERQWAAYVRRHLA